MKKGDIVLVPFPYTDLSGNKIIPAMVLINNDLDVTLAYLTTQLEWQEENDILVQPNPINGLKKLSLIRITKITTVDSKLIFGKLGKLSWLEIQELNLKLKNVLQLN
jgi:mRNA interferase MazF